MKNEEKYMELALHEAAKGSNRNWREPLVGCVIVKNKKVIATGYHQFFGGKHALIDALDKISAEKYKDCTVYLTMEPCDDCAKQLVKMHCQKLVIAQADPHPDKSRENSTKIALKSGKMIIKMGVLAEEAVNLNQHYSYFCKEKRPWITVKQTLSLDHHVSPANGKYVKVTNSEVKNFVQQEREKYQAIIIGSSSAIIDNPNLYTNSNSSHTPIRIVIDRRGRLLNNPGLNLLNNNQYETWIITNNLNVDHLNAMPHVKVFQLKTDQIQEVIKLLAKQGIQSAYVEGGPTLEKAFMDNAYVNQIIDYFSPIYFGSIGLNGAIPIHAMSLKDISVKKIGDHVRVAGLVSEKKATQL